MPGIGVLLLYFVVTGRIAGGRSLCAACNRPLHRAAIYVVHTSNGDLVRSCCPRCGLRYEIESGGQSAQATDFSSGRLIPAESAHYLEGSDIMECCSEKPFRAESGVVCDLHFDRCLPGLIAFADAEVAKGYQQEHGGRIITLAMARQSVAKQMGWGKRPE